jgi:hypothetical protein
MILVSISVISSSLDKENQEIACMHACSGMKIAAAHATNRTVGPAARAPFILSEQGERAA